MRDLSDVTCLTQYKSSDPFRILVGQARIAYQPFLHLGYFHFGEHIFWIHSWVENYREVQIADTYQNVDELKEVAFDIGIQLGCGHPKQIASPFDLQLRLAQLQWLEEYEPSLKQACDELALEVESCWREFRKQCSQFGITGDAPTGQQSLTPSAPVK